MNIEQLEKALIESVPQIPYVVDQIGFAMKWAKEAQDEGTYYNTIAHALEVAKYVHAVSEANFYKVHLVIGALLMDIDNPVADERFKPFDSASKSVENTLQTLKVNEKTVEDYGCFKAMTMHVVQLAHKDEDCFVIYMLAMLKDLEDISRGMKEVGAKSPITAEDYVKVLGYDLVMANIRMSNLSLLNTTREVLNNITIKLNNDFKY